MNIRITPRTLQYAIDCFACGEALEPDIEIATAYTPTGIELGPVCTHCLERSATQLYWRIQHHMATLRETLTTLEQVISENQARARRN